MYCSKCGSEISPAATFCATCGQAVSGVAPAAPAALAGSAFPATVPPASLAIPPAPPAVSQGLAQASYGGVTYAGFWLRLVAHLLDGLICGLAFVILLIPVFALTGAGAFLSKLGSSDDVSDAAAGFIVLALVGVFLGGVVLAWLYYAYAESSSWQGTAGKKLLNLYVTDMSGRPISFGRASGRFFARFVTNLIPLSIGYILAGFTEKKQAIHDMIASCLVLRRS